MRRYNRRYNRRTGTYKRKGYSMYKLYKNRSSGAQARQIYGLNKKLKFIQRRTRPEINIAPLVQSTFRSTEGVTVYSGSYVRYFGPVELTNVISQDATARTGFARLEGRFARIQNITLKGTFGYLNAEAGAVNPVDLQRLPAYARVVVYQTKAARSDDLTFSDIFSTSTAGTVKDSNNTDGTILGDYALMRAPLALGLARKAKVISDKLYTISDTKQMLMIKTKLNWVKNWYQAPNENVPKGQVYIVALLFNTAKGQSNDEDFDAASECRLDLISKCVYTDA